MTYLQYVISPVILGLCLYGFYYFFTTGNTVESIPVYYLPIMVWVSIVVIINIIKLRYIEVIANNILIKSISGERVLDYKDIEWINQNIFGSNWYILSIKYKDIKTGQSKSIFVFPEMYSIRERITMFGELNITKYIREQIIKANPSYNIENEPSRWYLVKWVFLSVIPFLLASFLLV